MASGKLSTPTGHVNLRMLAEYLELSQTTVSLVLNNSPAAKSIPQETRNRVLEAAKRLNYRPNYFARSLRQSRSMSVGVIAPDLSEGYFTKVMNGVVEEFTRAHYFFFTVCHNWDPELLASYPRMLVERAVDGFLLLNTPGNDMNVSVPVVGISSHTGGENVTEVILDHYEAVRLALTHLYELGHRRIAFMRGPHAIPDSDFRWTEIQKVAGELGLTLDPELIVYLETTDWPVKSGQYPMTPEIAFRPVQALLEKRRDFTAVFCFNDTTAIGVIRALKNAGLDVPGDVSVVGFDDIQSAAFFTPSLTTVRQPLVEMGQRAASVLLERITHKEKPFAKEVMMAPELIVRESTGPAKK